MACCPWLQVPSQSGPTERTQVLVLGLDGAGKSSLLQLLSTSSLEQELQPTQGFNAVSINRDNQSIELLESEWPGRMGQSTTG